MYVYVGQLRYGTHADDECITLIFPVGFDLADPVCACWQWTKTASGNHKEQCRQVGEINSVRQAQTSFGIDIFFGYYSISGTVNMADFHPQSFDFIDGNHARGLITLSLAYTTPNILQHPSRTVFTGKIHWFDYLMDDMATLILPLGLAAGNPVILNYQWAVDGDGRAKVGHYVKSMITSAGDGGTGNDNPTFSFTDGYYTFTVTSVNNIELKLVMINPKKDIDKHAPYTFTEVDLKVTGKTKALLDSLPALPRTADFDANTAESLQEWLDGNPDHPLRTTVIGRLVEWANQNEHDLLPFLYIHGVQMSSTTTAAANGSFAEVFRGSYQGGDVAIKRFRLFSGQKESSKSLRRFHREALIWRQLKHPNILSFLGISRELSTETDSMGMISPWMSRGTLMEYLNSADQASINHKSLIMDIAAGLDYLHAQQFVHGDLHGSNVFIDELQRALLGDFGLSALAELSHLIPTTTINKAGAARWLSPELIVMDDEHPPNKTTKGDIFAFGRICLSVFTRRVPFPNLQLDVGVAMKVLSHRHPSRPTKKDCHGVEMPDRLWDLVSHCWLADPAERPDIKYAIQFIENLTF